MNIILAHGILGFKNIAGVGYFNGLREHLEKKQIKVLEPVVTHGSIPKRGAELANQINEAFSLNILDKTDKTHIIAHSMGGLDSRYILSPKNTDNIAEYITSLTTISTPHKGSPIADFFNKRLDGRGFLGFIEKILPNFLDISIFGLPDLTIENASQFDEDYIDNGKVQYYWTSGIGRAGLLPTSIPFSVSYRHIKKYFNEENDGLVTLSSAVHGDAIGEPWQADHLDEVGRDLNFFSLVKPQFQHLEKYDEIIERISRL
jgi:triacylglycerol lipase